MTEKDTDVVVVHRLNPRQPYDVKWEVVEQSTPGVLYKGSKPAQVDYVVLRASVPGTYRVRLYIPQDAPLIPDILGPEAFDAALTLPELVARWPFEWTVQTLEDDGTLDDVSLDASFVHFRFDPSADSVITGFQAPSDGVGIVVFDNISVFTVQVLHQDTGSDEANRIIAESASGQMLGIGGRVLLVYDAITERWRLSTLNPGVPISVEFDAGNFTTNGAGGWTVAEADVLYNRWQQRGKIIHWEILLGDTSVIAATGTQLEIAFPFGLVPISFKVTPAWVDDNATKRIGAAMIIPTASEVIVAADPSFALNWTASVNATDLSFDLWYEVA